MAKRRSLFGGINAALGNPIEGFIQGMAHGAGVIDMKERERFARTTAQRDKEQRRAEQQKAYETAMKNQPPAEVPIDMGDSSEADAYLGKQPEQQQEKPAEVPEQQEPPKLFEDDGDYPPPVDIEQEVAGYVDQFENVPLNPEGQTGLIRLKQFADQIQSDDYLPEQKQELLDQFYKERDRLRLESKVQPPPSVESESLTRVTQAPNGMQTILQPDGRIDTKDPTTKAELEQLRLQHAEKQAQQQQQTKIQEMRSQQMQQRKEADAQARAERQAKEQEQQQKTMEDRNRRLQEHMAKSLKEKPMSARYAEAKKELEAAYKAANPKLPMKQFTPAQIQNFVENRMKMDFMAEDKLLNATYTEPKPKVTPEQRIREMIDNDPAAFNESVKDKLEELRMDNPEASRADAIKALMLETPEALKAEFESVVFGTPQDTNGTNLTGRLATSMPGLVGRMFGQGQSGADMMADGHMATPDEVANSPLGRLFGAHGQQPIPDNPLRMDPERLRQQIAKEFEVDPSEVSDEEVGQRAHAMITEQKNQALRTTIDQSRPKSESIKKAEGLLTDRQGKPLSLADVLDADTVEAIQQSGSENPLDDAAKAISKAIETDGRNILLYPPMKRESAKRAFPLVFDESEEGLDRAGVLVGQAFRDPYGTIKERYADDEPAAKAKDKPKSKTQTTFGRDNSNAKVPGKIQTVFGRSAKKQE